MEADVRSDVLGFSRAEALLYLCVSRCELSRLSRILMGVTALAAVAFGVEWFMTL